MRQSRRLRQSADNVLAEERRQWERETLRTGLVPGSRVHPPSIWHSLASQLFALACAAGVGGVAWVVSGERATGVAFGLAAGVILEAVLRERNG
jgi:hypothetical protein